jgi:Family of unknown function (DUF6600)/FecR protein
MHSPHPVGRSSLRGSRALCFGVVVACVTLIPGVALAQYGASDTPDVARWTDEIPAHLSVVDGTATLEREGRVDPAEPNQILLAGDRLRTDRGRVEILFEDGSALDIDQNSSLDLLSDSLVRLLQGRIRVTLARATNSGDYRIDSVAGTAWLRTAGEYRVSLSDPRAADLQMQLIVDRGSAELENDLGRTLVRAGTSAVVDARSAPSLPFAASAALADAFDRWAQDRRDERLGYTSTRYLPDDLRPYSGDFDRYGSWIYDASYGYVWYPRVTSTWRPYYDGRWSQVGVFGWVWVGAQRWSWPTHHYGRWGVTSDRWFWIPDRRWGPAWVSWATAPGYVGWCPLGFDGRPVRSLSVSIGWREPWRAWTVVPSRAFAPNVLVTRSVVAPQTWGAGAWSQFSVRPTGPATAARSRIEAAPLGAPGRRDRAAPRGDAGPRVVPGTAAPSRALSQASPDRRPGGQAPTRTAPPSSARSAPSTGYAQPRREASASSPGTGGRASGPAYRAPERGAPSRQVTPPAAQQPPRAAGPRRSVEPPRAPTLRTPTPQRVSPPPTSPPARTAPPRRAAPGGGQPPPAASSRAPSRVAPSRSPAPGRTAVPAQPSTPSGPSRGSVGRTAPPAPSGRGQAVRRSGRGGGGSDD